MPKPNLTDEDYSALAALVREAIDAEPYRAGPRIRRLRLLLAKLEPATEPISTAFPTPTPSAHKNRERSIDSI